MKTIRLTALLLLVSIFSVQAQTADQVIDKYYEVTGGKTKWSSVKSVRYKGTYEFGQGIEAPFTLLITSQGQESMRNDFTFQGLTATQVITGDSGWAIMPFQGKKTAEPLPAEAVKAMKPSLDIQGPLFDYQKKGASVEYLGKDDLEGSEVHKIKCLLSNGDLMYYYFDAESGLLLKESHKVKMQDKEVESSNLFSAYTKTDYGITIPYTTEVRGDGGSQFSKITSIEFNPTVKAEEFKRPN